MITYYITQINNFLNSLVWGPGMLVFLVGTGLILSLMTGFLQIRRFGYMILHTIVGLFSGRKCRDESSGISPFQAVATAMAATIGTGSIAGLATAIVYGGPGAVFWMWVSAFLGMVTKYSEIVLSVRFRTKNSRGQWRGGPMYYIKNGLKLKWLAILFSLFTMAACLGIGNAVQSNSIARSVSDTFGIEEYITGIILTVISASVILGGVKRIASVNEKLVPAMALFYVVCSVAALIVNREYIPGAFSLIFREAFNIEAMAGGGVGYGMMLAMRYGFSRGVFTNEAGLGSAPIAHSASNARESVEQALWGMFEVFFTTIIICTLSALVILTSGLWNTGKLNATALSIAAFNSALPGVGGICVTMATIFFALSTILGWGYYGEVSTEFVFGESRYSVLIYRLIYVAVVFMGAVGNLDLIWSISETMNGLMAVPNLIGVIGLSSIVRSETKKYFDKK